MDKVKVLAIVLAAAAMLVSACAVDDPPPGDPAVYSRIERSTDCGFLQDQFDIADGNHSRAAQGSKLRQISLSYMKASSDRMVDLGCP